MTKPTDVTLDILAAKAMRYMGIGKDITKLQTEKSDLATELRNSAATYGQKDEKGSATLQAGSYKIRNEKRVSRKLDEEKARALLKKKKLFDECVKIEQVEIFDEAAIEQAFYSGKITDDEMKSIMKEDISFAIRVEKKKDDA